MKTNTPLQVLMKISFLFLLFFFSYSLHSQTPTSGMNDAAVVSLDSPSTFCAGNQSVYATIANVGTNQIDSVDIHWEINGIAQPTVHYRQLLDTINGTSPFKTSVLLGSANFNAGNTTIQINTFLPNGMADTINSNDTLITVVQTATPPTGLTSFNGTTTSMDFDIFDLAGAVEYEYGLAGFAQGTGTMGSSTTNPFTISGLQASSNYDIYVRSNCSGTDTSIWVGPFNYCTEFAAPFYNDMESEKLNVPPACWKAKATYSSAWVEVDNYTGASAPYAGSQALYLYSSYSNPTTDTLIAVSPLLSDLTAGDKRVRFFANSDDPSSQLIIGTMANPDATVLNPIDTITFQVPDTYQEVIVELDSANGYNGKDEYFYLAHSLGGTYDYIRVDNFNYENIPTCLRPVNSSLFLNNLTSTSVDFTWTEQNNASEWEIRYDTTGFLLDTGKSSLANTNPYTISGLSPNSVYDIYVRSICNIGDTSYWSGPLTFMTPCTPITASYYNNFETDPSNEEPICWRSIATDNNSYAEVRAVLPGYTGTNAPYTGLKSLNMFSGNATSGVDKLMAITPAFSDLTTYDKQIRFFANTSDLASDLIIGTMASPVDTSLSPLDTIIFTRTDIYDEIIFKFDTASGYNGTDQYIYLKHSLGSTYEYIRIDEFRYEPILTCDKPAYSSLSIDSLTATSVDFSWIEPGTATLWEVEYEQKGFSLGTGISDTVSSIPASISGLIPDTVYQVYVRSICGAGDTSYASGPFEFETPCLPDTAPYYNNFEMDPTGQEPVCWSSIASEGNSWAKVESYTGTSAPYAGSRALYINSSNAVLGIDRLLAVSPGFSDLTAGNKRIRFFANTDQPISKLIIGTMSNPIDTGNMNVLDTIAFAQPNVYEEVIFEITAANGYNGSDQYIYLEHSLGGTYDYIRIDDFHYETIPSCKKPNQLSASNITPTSASLSWNEINVATKWQVQYDTVGFAFGNGTLDTISSNPYNLTGLNPTTTYEYYVRSICGRGDSSFWSGPYTFETPCAFYTTPYYNNFETDPTYVEPVCWSSVSTKNGPWAAVRTYLNPVSNRPYAGSRGLYMYSYNAVQGVDKLMAITPGFSDLTAGDKRIRFYANVGDTSIKMIIGTMPSPVDTANMHPLKTITFAQNDTYEEIVFEITSANGYNGTDQYIYLEHDIGKTYDFVRIDEFNYETIPSCKRPDSLSASNPTPTSATLSWKEPNAATEWQIQYGSLGFALGTGIDSIATSNPFILTNLSSGTYYEYYVRSICGSGDTSFWTGPFEFVTECPVSISAPYFNDFENEKLDMDPICWSSIASLNYSWVEIEDLIGSATPYSGSQGLYLFAYSANTSIDTVMAISPRFSGLTANNKRISFYTNSGDSASKLIVGTMSSPSSSVLNPIDTITYTIPNTYQEVEVQFNASTGYNGTDEYIYLMHSLEGTFSNILIDDFRYFEVPPIDAGITDMTAPENNINRCYTASENLNVEVVSFGTDSLDFTVDTTVVTVSVTGASTQTFSYTIDDNSLHNGLPLAEKDSIIVPMGTVDMSNPGVYYFDISLSMTNDGKVSNNTFRDTVRANIGGNIVGLDSICFGDSLILSTEGYVGSLQWQSSNGGAFTDIVGADSSEVVISPSTITSYRVLACGTGISDTLTVTPVPASAPLAKDSTVIVNCGDSAIVALTATSTNPNAFFEWYDAPTGGTALSIGGNITGISPNGDTLYYKGYSSASTATGTIDTLYVQEVVSTGNGICASTRDTAIATIDCLVGIEEAGKNLTNIAIYPNPSKGIFNLVGMDVEDELQLSIYNTNGKLVYSKDSKLSNNFNEKVDLSGLSKGVYFVKLQGKQSFEMRKIIIN